MPSKKVVALCSVGAVTVAVAIGFVAWPSSNANRAATAGGSGSLAASPASGAVDATAASAASVAAPGPVPADLGAAATVFLTDPANLATERASYRRGVAEVTAQVGLLIKRANKDLLVTPVSVTAKSQLPPDGTKHDYLSLSVYAWPNPHTRSGMPYVIRDGDRNPSVDSVPDKANLVNVINWSQELAYAYYFTGNPAYATKATAIISTWFLDPATRMDPNLKYAQGVPGASTGQPGGIIDAADLPKVVDAAGLLTGSAAWTTADAGSLTSWFAAYLSWLQTSANGKAEAATSNNHATWYDGQVISYALFVGDTALARSVATKAERSIIAAQITGSGTQPKELARTDSWSYSTYNVAALARLAQLASAAGVDLWDYRAPNGATIRKALDLVAGYATRMSAWPYPQSRARSVQYLAVPLYSAAAAYHSATFATEAAAAAAALPAAYPALSLIYPAA